MSRSGLSTAVGLCLLVALTSCAEPASAPFEGDGLALAKGGKPPITYMAIDLGTLGGTESDVRGMNNQGQIVGMSATETYGETRAYVWSLDGGISELSLPANLAYVSGINDAGRVIGILDQNPGPDAYSQAFWWSPETDVVLLPLLVSGRGCTVNGVNSYGDAAGSCVIDENFAEHAVLWPAGGGVRDLGVLGEGDFSLASDINDAGSVVGWATITSGVTHAFKWTVSKGMQDLGAAGGDESFAQATNHRKQVVGIVSTGDASITRLGVIWDQRGRFKRLPLGADFPAGDCAAANPCMAQATDVGRRGDVVGMRMFPDHISRATLWTAGGRVVDLGSMTDPPASYASLINDNGWIAGYVRNGHAFVWIPTR